MDNFKEFQSKIRLEGKGKELLKDKIFYSGD